MKIAIIGAGFTGLAAGLKLAKLGHQVTIFEKDAQPGGLAIGFQKSEWDWTLEKHYHHWFTNDSHVLNLAKEINYPVIIKRPKTAVYVDGKVYPLDSPQALLAFPQLSLFEKIRMAAVLAFLRINPIWQPLENINANKFLSATMGKKAYGLLWEPQLRNKMGKYADEISLVWFWSRIKKRTPSLAYPEKGFLPFANALVEEIKKYKGKVLFSMETMSIVQKQTLQVTTKMSTESFDKVIVTLPSFLFQNITPQLPEDFRKKLVKLHGLGATNLILRLDQKFLPSDTYWLSICEPKAPIMAIVEHTNFMLSNHYHNEHLVYLGNYPAPDSEKFLMSKEDLLKVYDPFLCKIKPDYKSHLLGYDLFKAPFAQPIVPAGYSKMLPPMITPLKNIYLANIEQVYPWDRGTNYAVELGQKVADLCINTSNQS